jgi:hypothetical protein
MTMLAGLWFDPLVPIDELLMVALLVAGWLYLVVVSLLRALFGARSREETPSSVNYFWRWALLGVMLLVLSIWPGLLDGEGGQIVLVGLVIAVVLAWLLAVFEARTPGACQASGRSRTTIVLVSSFVLGCVTLAVILVRIPCRVTFRPFRSQFADLIERSSSSPGTRMDIGRFVGPWYVDSVARDEHGGVFVRTWSTAEFADTLSYGFAYRPSEDRSPFGGAHYQLRPIGQDWFIFRVSDDA